MKTGQNHLQETSSQTAGPYVHIGLKPSVAGFHVYENEFTSDLAGSYGGGEKIVITGKVIDGDGQPVLDAMMEIWQADENGEYRREAAEGQFRGWGRTAADFKTGEYSFTTIKPGPARSRTGGFMAPHISFWVVARGINLGLHTRMYFPENEGENLEDPVLGLVGDADRRRTLVAEKLTGDGISRYQFNIYLQGDNETVFFDV